MSLGKRINFLGRVVTLFLSVLILANCASAPENDPEALSEFKKLNDPVEPFNRTIFGFNQGLDKAVIKPVTGAYRAIAPEPVRRSVHNVLDNLRTPQVFINDVLQGELRRAGVTLARFVINTTIGILGIWDQAADMGLEQHSEDFGQTLAVWSVPEGPYVMLPIFGPSNPRDAFGKVVDFFFDPLNLWAANTDRDWIPVTRTLVSGIDTRDQLWDVLEDLEKSSIDFYAAIRSLYRQRRKDEINNGQGADDKPAPGFSGDFEIAEPEDETKGGSRKIK